MQTPPTPIPNTRDIFMLAWPLAMNTVMIQGIVVIDAYLVSSLGEEALAAMGLAGALVGLLAGIIFSFSNATQIRIAQAFGSASPKSLKTNFYCGLAINLAVTILGLLILWIISAPIIDRFAHSESMAEQAKSYLNVFTIVIACQAVVLCLTSHFNGCGHTKMPFYSHLLSLPINIAISIVLIHGLFGFPALGLTGAAIGSAIAAVIQLIYLTTRFYQLDRAFIGVVGWQAGNFTASLKKHFIFSLPIATTFISATSANHVCVLLYANMSIYQFAAMTLIFPWIHIVGTIGISWSQATGIFVAQLLGKDHTSDDLDSFLSLAWRRAFIAAGLVSAVYAGVCLSSGWIYSELQPETQMVVFSFIFILVLLPFPKGSNAICGNTLRAGGDTVYVMNIFIGSQWLVKVPLTALFILVLELPALWVFSLFLFDEFVKFAPFHLRLYKGLWKRNLNAG